MGKHEGRLELTWSDKDKALLSTGDGRYDYTFVDPGDRRVSEVRLLRKVEQVEAPTPADRPADLPTPTTDNLLITGDAMHVLDALAKIPEYADKYLGQVKLVYIDPPFNTGKAFTHYEDGIDHSVWLTMMRDRLQQIMPLLSDDASIWVHLDDVESHRMRLVLDEAFGPSKHVATIIWEKDKGRRNDTDISSAHDNILVYAPMGRSWKSVRNLLPRLAHQDSRYQNPDGDPRGPWLQGDNGTAKSGTAKNRFPVTLPSGRVVTPVGRYWRFSPETLEEAIHEGRVWFGRDGDSLPVIKRYLSEVQQGLVPRTLWFADDVGTNQDAKRDHLIKMFPGLEPFSTPKPETLLRHIIHIATDPGDLVMDCFGGSGTTAAVAHKMGRRWVTSELLADTVRSYLKPRLEKVVKGKDPRGITALTARVAVSDLPESVTPERAQQFNTTLMRVLAEERNYITVDLARTLAKQARAAAKAGASPLSGEEQRTLLTLLGKLPEQIATSDVTKGVKSQLAGATKTREETTTLWHGGGGFIHLEVGPSMFDDVDGFVVLAEWATNGSLAAAMCAQVGASHEPDGVFAGRVGRTRVAVIDGVVGPETVDEIVAALLDGENVDIWATQTAIGAAARLKEHRPGSRVLRIPEAVLDEYRREASTGSPFANTSQEGEA